jgi:hypothetical protein
MLPAEVLQSSHVELEEPKRVQSLSRKKFGCKSTKSVMSLHRPQSLTLTQYLPRIPRVDYKVDDVMLRSSSTLAR